MWKKLRNRNSINLNLPSTNTTFLSPNFSPKMSTHETPIRAALTLHTMISSPGPLFFIMILLSQKSSMTGGSTLGRVLLLLGMMLALCCGTTVTFYVDHEVEQPLDYVDINLVVKADGQKLEEVIEEAAETIKKIENLVENYCKSNVPHDKQKEECKDLVEASAYSIKPQYEVLRKKELFAGFVVAHEVNINVKESQAFGKLVDDIMKVGVNKINSLEWKPKEEADGEEFAVEEGIAQANEICKKLGSTLAKVISVQEVTDFGEDPEEEEGGQEEEEEDMQQSEDEQPLDIKDDIAYYKFVVECQRKKAK